MEKSWGSALPPHHVDYWHNHTWIIEHYSSIGGDLPPPRFGPPGHRRNLRAIPCNTPGCYRCISGSGGYRFNIMGPWTPEYLAIEISGASSPMEHKEITNAIWCGRRLPPPGIKRFASPPSLPRDLESYLRHHWTASQSMELSSDDSLWPSDRRRSPMALGDK